MPELPEVEATKRYLVSEGIVGRELTGAAMSWPGAVRSGPVEDFVLGLTGRTIRDVGRRGKYITMALEAHVGAPAATLLPAYVRAALHLDDGREVRFRDPRKLGHLRLTEEAASVLGRLGPEPLDEAFTPDVLALALQRRSAPVKALLMDQSIIAGVGNIYADEALFRAGLHPARPGRSLTAGDVARLHEGLTAALLVAIEALTTAMPTERFSASRERRASYLLLPREAGLPCPDGDGLLERLVIRGRSAYFCPQRQRPGSPP